MKAAGVGSAVHYIAPGCTNLLFSPGSGTFRLTLKADDEMKPLFGGTLIFLAKKQVWLVFQATLSDPSNKSFLVASAGWVSPQVFLAGLKAFSAHGLAGATQQTWKRFPIA